VGTSKRKDWKALTQPNRSNRKILTVFIIDEFARSPLFIENIYRFPSLIMKLYATSLCTLVCLLGIPAIYQVSTTPGIFTSNYIRN
tara:strand:+ start:36 stop:293 length:258 start_codon:yes stop_codon:yes gene_type:complete